MNAKRSKTQIDRLGDRLREGSPGESDLRLLDEYRRSFGEAYETVIRTVRDELKLEPTGRPAKSTRSIIEKLDRETIRLSQVQDIAGCRVVVTNIAKQEGAVASLRNVFPRASVIDRRAKPNYGYRAVHIVAQISERLIEIQVRSSLQHLWAELSEKFSDVFDPAIKYGGGRADILDGLTKASDLVARHEETEQHVALLQKQARQDLVEQLQQEAELVRREIEKTLADAISRLEKRKREKL